LFRPPGSGPVGPEAESYAEVVVPRIKSAKKRLRQTRAHTVHNRTQRSQLRTAIKRVRTAGTAADAEKAYAEALKIIDRAGRKNLIHRNAADRQKSRLAKVVKGRKA
jgi:small subunit ribosomal protein S20